jgi:regulator of protease activity HflC (stomatin/prohibitin superfamily)
MIDYVKVGSIDKVKIIKNLFIGLVLLIILFSTFGTIGAGEVGVRTRFSKVVGTIQPGIYMKLPLIEQVHKIDIKVKTVDYDKNGVEGDAVDTSALSASSKDLQAVWANIVVNYSVNPANAIEIYTNYRSAEQFGFAIVEPIIRETVKSITAQYTAEELVTKRLEISDKVFALLSEQLPAKGAILSQSNLTNFDFSPAFNKAIEDKVTAVQNAETQKNKLEQIKYEAQQTIETAKATAEAQRISAQALAAQGGSDYVQLKAIEKWDGHLPAQMIPNSSVPFINLKN